MESRDIITLIETRKISDDKKSPFLCPSFLRLSRQDVKRISVSLLVAGFLLIPSCQPAFAQNQTASFYTVKSCLKESCQFIMANGKELQDDKLTAASWDYPFKTKVKITNTRNGRSVVCEITDRGPNRKLYRQGRIIDLSYAAMRELDGIKQGIISIEIEVVK